MPYIPTFPPTPSYPQPVTITQWQTVTVAPSNSPLGSDLSASDGLGLFVNSWDVVTLAFGAATIMTKAIYGQFLPTEQRIEVMRNIIQNWKAWVGEVHTDQALLARIQHERPGLIEHMGRTLERYVSDAVSHPQTNTEPRNKAYPASQQPL